MHLDALSYVEDVVRRMEAISTEEYFLRTDRATELLIHEEWPLACLAKTLYHPRRRIKVLYKGNQPHGIPDAELIVEGTQKEIEGWNDLTPVEITTVHFADAHIVRRELGLAGASVGRVVDPRNELRDFALNAVEALRKKYRKAYSAETMILCAIFPDVSFGFDSWYHFFNIVKGELGNEIKYKTFLLDTFTGQHHILYVPRH